MEGFSDLLEDIKRQGGPLMWITQKKNFVENTNNFRQKRTPEQIKQDVLQSARLKHVIDQILIKNSALKYSNDCQFKKNEPANPNAATDSNSDRNKNESVKILKREDIMNEAKSILDEMAHQFDLKYVRVLGYALMKVFSRIYKHIYYNSDLKANLQVLKNYPTLLLPLHRSYMDFLLVSIVCYHNNIQLPAVAAGQDFLGLSFLSNVIRHTGAFFIRRSFGSDELYWAVFHQYVQEHLSNCDRPLEFFIEGTRSRTSKSLTPKLGMLSTCVELYMKGQRVEDVYFVPISLTYERLLEEILYSNELLGIPKPKETVGGLVKARTILNQSYGSIFVNFARPLSLRELINTLQGPNLKNRLTHTLTPSFIFELNPQQNKIIESFSYVLLNDMLKNQVIQPISIISICLLQCGSLENKYSVNFEVLCKNIEKLKRILSNLGCKVYWPVDNPENRLYLERDSSLNDEVHFELNRIKHVVLNNIEIHSNLFDFYRKNQEHSLNKSAKSNEDLFNVNVAQSRRETIKDSDLILSLKQPHRIGNKAVSENLFESASIFLALCSYRNQMVSFLIRTSLVINSLLTTPSTSADKFDEAKSFDIYKFLTILFNKEFIFKQGEESKDYADSLTYLSNTNLIKYKSGEDGSKSSFELVKFNIEYYIFFARIFLSFICNYYQIYKILIHMNNSATDGKLRFNNEKDLTKSIQTELFNEISKRIEISNDKNSAGLFDMESLSLNLITNSILSLRQLGVLERFNQNKTLSYELDLFKLASLNDKLLLVINANTHRIAELSKSTETKCLRKYDGDNLEIVNETEFSRANHKSKL